MHILLSRSDRRLAELIGYADLGLALARSMVQAPRGRMWLELTPGGGVTAKIALPLA